MDLALLELTETASGDVVEQLVVTTTAEAVVRTRRTTRNARNRLRVYAQLASELPGVPRDVRVHLDRVALDGVAELARRHLGPNLLSTTFMALWHHGRLQVLTSQSIDESLAAWQRLAGPDDESMLFELSDPAPTATAAADRNLDRFYAHLRHTR